MKINFINGVSFSSKGHDRDKTRLYREVHASITNPNPTTPPPPPPGEKSKSVLSEYDFEIIKPQNTDEKMAINVNPKPETEPPLPPGYKIYVAK